VVGECRVWVWAVDHKVRHKDMVVETKDMEEVAAEEGEEDGRNSFILWQLHWLSTHRRW